MPELTQAQPDLTEQIAELEREIQQRKRVYPRLIEDGTLTPQVSAYRIRCLEATIEQLKARKAMMPEDTANTDDLRRVRLEQRSGLIRGSKRIAARARRWADNPTGRCFAFAADWGPGGVVQLTLDKEAIEQRNDEELERHVAEVIEANRPEGA